jgi:hypothetical protein
MSSSQKEQPWLPILCASATAGALARIPLHPVDTIKCKLQTLPTQSGWALLRSTWRAEGIRGLFPGLGISVVGSAPGQTLYFTSYEMSKRVLAALPIANEHSDAVNFASGLLAETVSCVIWVPIDVVKERLQTQAALDPSLQYRGAGDALRTIAKNEGWRGFYRGYGATVLSFGPFSALYLMFYERLRALAINRRLAQGVPNARELPTSVFAMCGAAAGAGASILTNPMDIAKCRMQVRCRSHLSDHSISVIDLNFDLLFVLSGRARWHGRWFLIRLSQHHARNATHLHV